jgi:microcystin-dependent protein
MAAEPYVGQIQSFGFSFNPRGWVPCDGRTLAISEYEVLYTLIGTTYGGNGTTNFAVPDMRGRVPIGYGNGASTGLSQYVLGQKAGHESLTLSQAQMPLHSHVLTATGGTFKISAQVGTSPTPSPATATIGAADYNGGATGTNNAYNNLAPDVTLNTGATGGGATITTAGGGIPIENMEPFLTINYCICTEGVYPTQS